LERYIEIIETKIETQVKPLDSVKQAIRRSFEMAIQKNEQQPIGCLTVNKAVELSLFDKEAAEKVVESFYKAESLLYELLLCGQNRGKYPIIMMRKDSLSFSIIR